MHLNWPQRPWQRVRNPRIRPVLETLAAIPFALPIVVIAFGLLQVSGTVTSDILIGNTYRVELYRIDPDPSGKGEGRSYVGSADVAWNFAGNFGWTILDPSGPGCYTATLTESSLISGVSSEFSPNLGTRCAAAHLPFVLR